MTYLIFALIILAGLAGGLYLAWAIAEDLRTMERDDQVDDIGGRTLPTDAEIARDIKRWRDGK